jgi:DNA polymerase-1
MILKILREKAPDYFAVVFDSPAPTKRHKAYEEYKAHRPKMPDDLALQIQPIKDIIDAFNIPNIEIEGYEADDTKLKDMRQTIYSVPLRKKQKRKRSMFTL